MRNRRRALAVIIGLAMIVATLLVVSPANPAEAVSPAPGQALTGPVIEVLSSPAEYVSGGDARVAIHLPESVDPESVEVTLGNRDVSESFALAGAHRLEGVVSGLVDGRNRLQVRVGPTVRDRLDNEFLINHPISGPMFSGPHQEPFFCQTEAAGLGPALDDDCYAETKTELWYMTTGGAFAEWPTSGPPADLAQTTTTLGETVDYIVKLETGVINRAVYQTAILYSPIAENGAGATAGWNDRLVYTFGGGCNAGYAQGAGNGGVLNDTFLAKGYGVASSTLNVLNNNCNDVLSAETALMVKERFIESYGKPRHTIGWGGSGGAIQQHLIAHNYPGILDGIIPTLSYPDVTTIFPGISDCRLLFNYFDDSWDAAARAAVVGYDSWNNCLAWEFSFTNRLDATAGCNPIIPADIVYHPVTNPDGVRCAITDHLINVLGIEPATGNAPTFHDNLGVQYGLAALENGDITVDQFLDLNADIGGFDTDGVVSSERSDASRRGLRKLYRTGRVVTGKGLAEVPIIDFRPYLDTTGDIHDRFRSFALRQRLLDDNGNADNQAIWITGDLASWFGLLPHALATMDEWLTGIDFSHGSPSAAEVIAAKPAAAMDTCWDAEGAAIVEPATFVDPDTACNQLYPNNVDPRIAAGADVASTTLKCHRRVLSRSLYDVEFSDDQWARLRAIFRSGVCDYSRGDAYAVSWAGPWQSFGK